MEQMWEEKKKMLLERQRQDVYRRDGESNVDTAGGIDVRIVKLRGRW